MALSLHKAPGLHCSEPSYHKRAFLRHPRGQAGRCLEGACVWPDPLCSSSHTPRRPGRAQLAGAHPCPRPAMQVLRARSSPREGHARPRCCRKGRSLWTAAVWAPVIWKRPCQVSPRRAQRPLCSVTCARREGGAGVSPSREHTLPAPVIGTEHRRTDSQGL